MCLEKRLVLRSQAVYYLASGAWPLLSRRLFEAVTGPKTDWWLVQMVALLALSTGATLGAASRRKKLRSEIVALSVLTAASFATIDVVYVAKRRLEPVYLGDAAVELALAALLVLTRP